MPLLFLDHRQDVRRAQNPGRQGAQLPPAGLKAAPPPSARLLPRGLQEGAAIYERKWSRSIWSIPPQTCRILVDHDKGALENRCCRTLILFQYDHAGTGKVPLEQPECCARCPTETVNRLVRIAYREYVAFVARERGQDLHLRKVRVLKFVHEDESRMNALLREQVSILLEQIPGARDHVAERAEVLSRNMVSTVVKTRAISRQRPRISSSVSASASLDFVTRGTGSSPRSSLPHTPCIFREAPVHRGNAG